MSSSEALSRVPGGPATGPAAGPPVGPAGAGPAAYPAARPRRAVSSRLLRSELGLVFRRRRNQALLVALAGIPVLVGVAVRLSAPHAGEGPAFLGQITQNGLFLAFTALVVAVPFFLPLALAVVAGESVAGEAGTGTLRYLLTVPASRPRLLAVKYAGIVAYGVAAAGVVALTGILVGLALFPVGPVTLLSGATIGVAESLLRAGLVAAYVAAMLAGLGAIGLFVSTLTEVPVGAMAATAALAVAAQILDVLPQLRSIQPYLFSHRWLAFGELLRTPIAWHEVTLGLVTQAVYVAVFLALAWARLGTKDVTS